MKFKYMVTGVLFMAITSAFANTNNEYINAPIDTIFGQGEINPFSKYFTGRSYLQEMSDGSDVYKVPISNVTFEPCTRTDWHYHTGGQILMVVAGEGRFQFKEDAQPRIIKKGDVIRIAPNQIHWHGAGLNTWMSHVTLMPNQPNETVWLDKVTDEEFSAEPAK